MSSFTGQFSPSVERELKTQHKPTIGIDCRTLAPPIGGIGYGLREIIRELRNSGQFRILLFAPDSVVHADTLQEFLGKDVSLRSVDSRIHGKIGVFWYLFVLPWLARDLSRDDFFFSPANYYPWFINRPRKILLVHDFVGKFFPETMHFANRILDRLFFSSSVRNSDVLWTNSEYTRDLILRHYPRRKAKEIFVGYGVKRLYSEPVLRTLSSEETCERFGLSQPFLLFVGNLEPRKNLKFLVSLAPGLKRHGVSLVVAGSKGWNSSLRASAEQEDSTRFLGFVEENDLVSLFRAASITVMSSLNEGLGLPLLEAQITGCPVLAADNSGMREVVISGKLIPGWDPEDWTRTILGSIGCSVERATQESIRAKYNWSTVVHRFLDHLDKLGLTSQAKTKPQSVLELS